MVSVDGFEPTTSCTQNKRTTRLCYTPFILWLGRQDSNLQPTVPKTVALPIELLPNNSQAVLRLTKDGQSPGHHLFNCFTRGTKLFIPLYQCGADCYTVCLINMIGRIAVYLQQPSKYYHTFGCA